MAGLETAAMMMGARPIGRSEFLIVLGPGISPRFPTPLQKAFSALLPQYVRRGRSPPKFRTTNSPLEHKRDPCALEATKTGPPKADRFYQACSNPSEPAWRSPRSSCPAQSRRSRAQAAKADLRMQALTTWISSESWTEMHARNSLTVLERRLGPATCA